MSKTFNIIHIVFLIILLLNYILSQNYKKYNLKIELNNTELEPLFIEDNNFRFLNEFEDEEDDDEQTKERCSQWIPSLINSISLYDPSILTKGLSMFKENFELNLPNFPETFIIDLFDYKLFEKYDGIVGKIYHLDYITMCYFGLSCGISEYDEALDEIHINLNILRNTSEFEKAIFSFDNWTLSSDNLSITSTLYFGDIHENFNSTKGIIGTCDADKNDPYWGCIFKNISFNNNSIGLTNDRGEYYKIFFTSENHNIIIPISFKEKFDEITKNDCEEISNEVICNFFGNKEYIELILIDEENMNITIEIDNLNRYSLDKQDNKKSKTRIKFGEKDFFFLPLIMFKRFHVQFDAENYKIKFYTTDDSILKIKKDQKEDKEKGSSSKVGTVFLVIFIILLILGLGYGVFWLLKKRRNSVEKNINKYNKFEDEENFQDMNEKRIF